MKGMGMAQHQPMIMAHFLPIVSHVTPVMKLNTALPTPKKTAHNCISNVNMQSVQCCPYPENKYSMEYVPTKKKYAGGIQEGRFYSKSERWSLNQCLQMCIPCEYVASMILK